MVNGTSGQGSANYFAPSPATAKPCPSCGHCPTCGRSKPVPHNPYTWPYYAPYPNYPYYATAAPQSSPKPNGTYTLNGISAAASAVSAAQPNGANLSYLVVTA